MFKVGDKVKCYDCPAIAGTIKSDDGYNVCVKWDDGKIGNLIYDNNVRYNAYRLVKCK